MQKFAYNWMTFVAMVRFYFRNPQTKIIYIYIYGGPESGYVFACCSRKS